MIYKSRTKSQELLTLASLNHRMKLSKKDKQHYLNLKKGQEGEVYFDSLIATIKGNCYILNDLLLKVQSSMLQIDSLLIFPETIYLFEIKNFDGDYYYESDRIYNKTQSEINNPLHQLQRSELLLRKLLQELGIPFPIHASVVFVNPNFTLYQAPLNKPLVFPTQLKQLINKLNTTNTTLTPKHKRLADKLVSLHLTDSPFEQTPAYEFEHLQKGIFCPYCHSFSLTIINKHCICDNCSNEESLTTAVMRQVDEFKLLFPKERITTNIIYEWCKIVDSKKQIKRILEENLTPVGGHRWRSYE